MRLDQMLKKIFLTGAGLALSASLSTAWVPAAGAAEAGSIHVTEIRMASGIDERYEPVGPTEAFPIGTAKVYCWFSWENAPADMALKARWTYLTKKIKIFEYPVSIPKSSGAGGIAMAMPKGRSLPPGAYRIELLDERKKAVKSLDFSVGV
jgi:hypothetical protein